MAIKEASSKTLEPELQQSLDELEREGLVVKVINEFTGEVRYFAVEALQELPRQ